MRDHAAIRRQFKYRRVRLMNPTVAARANRRVRRHAVHAKQNLTDRRLNVFSDRAVGRLTPFDHVVVAVQLHCSEAH